MLNLAIAHRFYKIRYLIYGICRYVQEKEYAISPSKRRAPLMQHANCVSHHLQPMCGTYTCGVYVHILYNFVDIFHILTGIYVHTVMGHAQPVL